MIWSRILIATAGHECGEEGEARRDSERDARRAGALMDRALQRDWLGTGATLLRHPY